VIGTAGGKAKCDWLKNELGFDGVIDYHSEDVGAQLSALCPDGIDVFFDNVGGVVLNEVLARLRLKARIVLCGAISRYNDACAYRKSNPAILMVQSAQDRAADDIPGPLNAAMDRGILVQ
jgi:NADPH-dependent curcumin reductase CurA